MNIPRLKENLPQMTRKCSWGRSVSGRRPPREVDLPAPAPVSAVCSTTSLYETNLFPKVTQKNMQVIRILSTCDFLTRFFPSFKSWASLAYGRYLVVGLSLRLSWKCNFTRAASIPHLRHLPVETLSAQPVSHAFPAYFGIQPQSCLALDSVK